MWDPIASASAFYPKPGDESASSRKFPCFVRISSFFFFFIIRWLATPVHHSMECLLLDTHRALPPSNRLHWKSGTPPGSYVCLLFEAAEK